MAFTRIGHLKTVDAFRQHLAELGLELPCDDAILTAAQGSPLAQPISLGSLTAGNRWCIHPMEGWDANHDGTPSEHTVRRWGLFGQSGAKLIWGGEAFAVVPEGRANPNQLFLSEKSEAGLNELISKLKASHLARMGSDQDLVLGLQLTHSGRFCRPNRKDKLEPLIAYHHPLLDGKFGIDPSDDAALLSDDQLYALIDKYVEAARLAQRVGFHFVDVKHCHGYLGHELLSAFDRPGDFGGSFENRTRFLRLIAQAIRQACPGLELGVRLSLFDQPPHRPDPDRAEKGKLGPGIPERHQDLAAYPGFGCQRDDPLAIDLTEPIALLRMLKDQCGVCMVNLSAGSPYYVPHIQRPAYFPPSDGYQPPEDPLVGCVRQIQAVRQVKQQVPDLPVVGTAYTYFQEYLPHVAQAVVRQGWVDVVGVGRMVLAYPELCADALEHGELIGAKRICRTFSDCTTAPRNGLISGCYPLDEYFKNLPENEQLKQVKKDMRAKLTVSAK